MLSNRPYLLRAFYQWIVDSACTPILVLDAHHPRCQIPQDYAEGDEIVFNISATAIRDLKITNDFVEFKAAFSGVIHLISAPIKAVLAIYAEENGEGIFFDADEEEDGSHQDGDRVMQFHGIDGTSAESSTPPSSNVTIKSKPFLKLIE